MKKVTDSKLRILRTAIENFTSNNQHNYSVLVLADFLGADAEHTRINQIIDEHERIGHMPYELIQERSTISKKLFEQLGVEYGEKTRHIIESAF